MAGSGGENVTQSALVIGNRPPGASPLTAGRIIGPRLSGLRKIAIIGNATTVHDTPWDDESWEVWAHASTRHLGVRVDRYFDLHPRSFWAGGKKWDPQYHDWLKTQPIPIFMQRRHADIPASVTYPKDRIMAEFGRYFTSQTAWMIALALTEGVTHLGMFGVHYATNSEYVTQRAGCEYWLGVAWGRGVQVVIPAGNPVLKTPHLLYGYESHNDGRLHDCYRPDLKRPVAPSGKPGVVFDAAHPPVDLPPLKDLGVPVDMHASGYPKGYRPGVRGDTSWQRSESAVKGVATTTSRRGQRRAANGSSAAKQRRAKSLAASRSPTR